VNLFKLYEICGSCNARIFKDEKKNNYLEFWTGDECILEYKSNEMGDIWERHGMVYSCKVGVEISKWKYLEFDIFIEEKDQIDLQISLETLNLLTNQQRDNYSKKGKVKKLKTTVSIKGKGWHNINIPLRMFEEYQAFGHAIKYVEKINFKAESILSQKLLIKNLRLKKGNIISLSTDIRSKAGLNGEVVDYEVVVENNSENCQSVVLEIERYGWEEMNASVEPNKFILEPNEKKICHVYVQISNRIPPAGREKQVLRATTNGDMSRAEYLELITSRFMPHPYIIHTKQGWDEVREKVKNYKWANIQAQEYIDIAEKWVVPEPNYEKEYLFHSYVDEDNLIACSYAYMLTGDKKYAKKVAKMLRFFSHPTLGYPKTMKVCQNSLVQEGHFFQHLAVAYDIIYDSGELNEDDHKNIEKAFRLYLEMLDGSIKGISNWEIFELTGAVFCSLAIQDIVWLERFLFGPFGIAEQISRGILDDGWWYECAIGYNLAAAKELTQIANACDKFGYSIGHTKFPATYHTSIQLKPSESEQNIWVSNEAWGKITRSYRTIKDLWDSLVPFADYRGVIFGVNDAVEYKLDGKQYDLAYYYYKDPKYAEIIRITGQRDLIFGIPELPEINTYSYKKSHYSENSGLIVLRSNSEGKPIREQIQAVLKYGVHGGAHGHFDRASLLSIMRYGRSYYNPISIWYGYASFMYRFFIQSSINHNMVVVDLKQQEPVESELLMFYTGKKIQAASVQTKARWSYPQYGGLRYDPHQTFEEKCWEEGKYVKIPENPPEYAKMTQFTEPILQKRTIAVLDDYIFVLDYLKGDNEHTFDCIYQIKGFKDIKAKEIEFINKTEQLTDNPLSGAQFITNCLWYKIKSPAICETEMEFGKNADNKGMRTEHNEDGILRVDIHSLYPNEQEVFIGIAPELHEVHRRLWYEIIGDDKKIADGKFGAWILGRDDLELNIDGIKELQLKVKAEVFDINYLGKKIEPPKTIFWGDPYIETFEGKKIYLYELPYEIENCDMGNGIGIDYYGGRVCIAGKEFKKAFPANPIDYHKESIIKINLQGINAKKFVASIGGDFPLGDEKARKRVYGLRCKGNEAIIATIVEPYEEKKMVKEAYAESENEFIINLYNGKTQKISVENLKENTQPIIRFEEWVDGKLIHQEESI